VISSPYACARWVTADDEAELNRFLDANQSRIAQDAADAWTILTPTPYEMKVVQDMWPKIHFHAQREHAGLSLDKAA
jgi:peptide chain release factor 3